MIEFILIVSLLAGMVMWRFLLKTKDRAPSPPPPCSNLPDGVQEFVIDRHGHLEASRPNPNRKTRQ